MTLTALNAALGVVLLIGFSAVTGAFLQARDWLCATAGAFGVMSALLMFWLIS